MFSLFQRKLPLTAAAIVVNLWIATQTAAVDTVVNRFGKIAVFNHAHRLAGVKRQPLSGARRLHPALSHGINQPVLRPLNFRFINVSIKTQLQSLRQTVQPPAARSGAETPLCVWPQLP